MSFSISRNLPSLLPQPLEVSVEAPNPYLTPEELVTGVPSSQNTPLVLSENLPSALQALRQKWDRAVAAGDKEPFREIENNFATIEKGLQDQPLLALEYMGPIFLARLQSNGGDLYFKITGEADSPQKKCATRWQKALYDYLLLSPPKPDTNWMQVSRLCGFDLPSRCIFGLKKIRHLLLNCDFPADLEVFYLKEFYSQFQNTVAVMPPEEVRDFHQSIRQLLQKHPKCVPEQGVCCLKVILNHAPWLDSTSSLFTAEDFSVFIAVEKEASLSLKIELLRYIGDALLKCSKSVDKGVENVLFAEKIFAYLFPKIELRNKIASEELVENWDAALILAFLSLVQICPNIEGLMSGHQKKTSGSYRKEIEPYQKKFIDYLLQGSNSRPLTSTKWFTLFSLRSTSVHTQAFLREACLNILKTSPYQDRKKGDNAAAINRHTAFSLQDVFIDFSTGNAQKKSIKGIEFYSFQYDSLGGADVSYAIPRLGQRDAESALQEILSRANLTAKPLLKDAAYAYLFYLLYCEKNNSSEWIQKVSPFFYQIKQLKIPEFDEIFKTMDDKRKQWRLTKFPHQLYTSRCPKLSFFVIKNDTNGELPSYIDASHPLINHNLNKAFMDKIISSLEAEGNQVWNAFLKIFEELADNKIMANYFLGVCTSLCSLLNNDFFDLELLDIRFRFCKLCCHFGFSKIHYENPSTIEAFIVKCMVNFKSANKIKEAGLVDWLDISLEKGLFASEKARHNLIVQGTLAVLYGTLGKSKGIDQDKAPISKKDLKTINLIRSLCLPSEFSYLMSLPEGGRRFIQVQDQIETISIALAREFLLYQERCLSQDLDENLKENGTKKQKRKVLLEKLEKDRDAVQEMLQAFSANFKCSNPPSIKKLKTGYQALLKARDASLKENEEQYNQQMAEIEKAQQRVVECCQKVENVTKILAAEFDELLVNIQNAEKQTELSKGEFTKRLNSFLPKEEMGADALKQIDDAAEDLRQEANHAIARIRGTIFSPDQDLSIQLNCLQEELEQKKTELEQTKNSLTERIAAIALKDKKIEKQKKRLVKISSEKSSPQSELAFPVMPATLKGKIEEFAHKKISRQFFLYSQKPTSKHALKTLLEVCGFQFAGTEGSHEHYKWYLSDRSVFSAVTLSDHGDELQPAASKDALKAIGKVITHQLEMKRYEQMLLKRGRPSITK